jgi:hypothetical protein
MARTIAVRLAALQKEEGLTEPKPKCPRCGGHEPDFRPSSLIPLRTLALPATYQDELDSPARLITARGGDGPVEAPLPPDRPAYNSLAWRAEAWKREQEREKRSARIVPTPRRRSIA